MKEVSFPPTASISDALDRLGLTGALVGIRALAAGQRMSGPVFTARYEPVDENGGTVGDFLDDVPAGSVIVIDNDANTSCTVWGGIMTQIAFSNRVAGTVVNGACRDTAIARDLEYPIWSVGTFMRTGKDRVRLAGTGEPLTIGDVRIYPGDLIVGDDDGVVVVPADRADEALQLARQIESTEDAIVGLVRSGTSLREARGLHGYHALQAKEQS